MPEYPTYPGSDPEQPDGGHAPPPPPPPPPGAWPSPAPQGPAQQPGSPSAPGVQPPPGTYPVHGQAYGGYGPVPPKHPNATTSMVLGIVGIAGAFICALPIFLAPFAWFMGAKAVRDIDASGGQQSGRSEAMAGKVLGIVGTVLMVIGLAFVALLIVLAIVDPSVYDE